jgi:hypothetical protein
MVFANKQPFTVLTVIEGLCYNCHELSQSRYKLHTKWATTCTIGSSKYKNLKLKKREKKKRMSIALRV